MSNSFSTHGRRRLASCLLVMGLFSACSSGGSSSETPGEGSEEAADPNAVKMELIQFKPANITVDAGTEITWAQLDPGFHTVTSGVVIQGGGGVTVEPDGKFESGDIPTDDEFSFTFDEPGTFPYYCDIHPATMRGEVRVS
ncbi:MAG: cupredoxin domain-containing protein [Actinomycetota bacterium]